MDIRAENQGENLLIGTQIRSDCDQCEFPPLPSDTAFHRTLEFLKTMLTIKPSAIQPLATLTGLILAAAPIRADLANSGFEADGIAAKRYSALVPSSWTNFGSAANYVADGTAFPGTTGAHGGSRYYLTHAAGQGYSAIKQKDSSLSWAALAVGDTLTVSAWTTYRSDISGAADTYFWLNPSDTTDLYSSPMNVTDVAAGIWTQRVWKLKITQTLLDRAVAGKWGSVEVGLGILWKAGGDVHQQVAFDDVSLVHIPALKRADNVQPIPTLVHKPAPERSTHAGGPGFNRDIRPILSENCYYCHGQDPKHRGGDRRLDSFEEAVVVRDGVAAIVPSDPKVSEIMRRIVSKDPDEMMPPPDSHKANLKPEQIAMIEKWIASGAEYEPHWSFVPPEKSETPASNPVDYFIEKRLKADGLQAAPLADDHTLVRRAYLDLTGLPPTPLDIATYLDDKAPDHWGRLIDRLMASPHFAERLALPWLDGARYSDTHGYSIDDHRDMWAWRDWVINAFQKNEPYNQFILEQIAGDLIPAATPDQIAATGFLRNSMNTHEGGTIAEEYRVNYTVDKVDAVATSILGLTMRCAQCHDHKFDPFSQKEYYRFFAFFNTSSENGKGAENASSPPVMEYKSPLGDGGMQGLKDRVAELEYLKANPTPILATKIADVTKSVNEEIRVLKLDIDRGHTSVMVMDHKPGLRKTHILTRGAYDQPGEEVSSGVPAVLPPIEGPASLTRLDLARWITRPDHPLTSRVAVNRMWQMVFGRGIVETAGDFGNQGSWPTHPELLDWLAVDFVEHGWNLRQLLKTILTSETYRRSAAATPQQLEKDPRDLLFARSPRTRLPAEIIRDQALAVSGLLNPAMGGPGVFPLQPDLWSEISHFGYPKPFTAQIFLQGRGSTTHRRSLYSFWKRTSPPPVLALFDAPTRETCAVVRGATNTPLQALVVMNEPQFVEAGVALGNRMIQEGGPSPTARLTYGFRLATGREPETQELKLLEKSLTHYLTRYTASEADAKSLAGTPEQAAYAVLGSTLINLDEFINRP